MNKSPSTSIHVPPSAKNNNNGFTILIICLVIILLAGVIYLYTRVNECKEEIKQLVPKCIRLSSDSKIQSVVEDMPQFQLLISSNTDAKNLLSEAKSKLINDQNIIKTEIAKLDLDLKTLNENFNALSTNSVKKNGNHDRKL